MKGHVPDQDSPAERIPLDDRETIIDMVQKNKSFANYEIGAVDLAGVNLRGGNFQYALFKGTNLEGADLKGANLAGANLRQANLRYAVLYRCNLYKVALPLEILPEEISLSVNEGTRIRYNKSLDYQKRIVKLLKTFQDKGAP
jgi:hypothetical protein